MEPNDLVACLKVLNFFGLESNHLTVQRLLHQVKDQINNFMPNHLTFLSFLLKKMNPTPITDALLIAIPMVFDLNLCQRIDHNNAVELAELLHFLTTSSMQISSKSMTTIIASLLQNSNSLDVQQAKSVIWSLTRMRELDRAHEKLYQNCMQIVSAKILELPIVDLETTLQKIIDRHLRGDSLYLSEIFLESIVTYIIEKEVSFLEVSYILKKFNSIFYVSHRLLDYVNKAIVDGRSNLSSCKFAGLLTFVGAFSIAGYKTENWEIVKSLLFENPLIHSDEMKLPWIKFALEMFSIDCHSNILLEKVFNTDFLEEFLSRQDNLLDYSQLLLLWQSVKLLTPDYDGPLPQQRFIDDAKFANFRRPNENFVKVLADIFGGSEFIQTNVESSYGHRLDYVICFDTNKEPIKMPCKAMSYDELLKSQVTPVAVFFNRKAHYPLNMPNKLRGIFELRRRTIEALGIKNVQVSTSVWNNLPRDEKLAFLEREIRYTLKP